ncbi:anthranilate phosphoribosyltransferase [Micromonospora sp. DT48]|uniref:anthranilate phosphoribosyltransferase n=1 Tax=unclassified Micromonospora TaxID=2617518 RepID=UPI0012BB49E7|nr:anthranilate phosphoribosyltransferase [Micromonospora sp. CP22]MTK03331.1 anthranilate phosphoribosyltransferase [Micromonospora sp. CP22]
MPTSRTLAEHDASFLRSATRSAVAGADLDATTAARALTALLSGADDTDAAALLTALAAKGPSATEVAATVRVVLAAAPPVAWTDPAVDIVGTGGDGSDSVNISTVAALIATAAGATVAKAGNRAATSRCGSADLLEALGVPVDPSPDIVDSLRRHRFAFLFTPAVHPAMRTLAPLRRRLGFRTIFNLSGPLANPVPLTARLVGAADAREQEVLAAAAAELGDTPTWVVRSASGLDELSTAEPSTVIAVARGRTETFRVDPRDLPVAPAGLDELRGGDARHNAQLVRDILTGVAPRPVTDTCLLNAAAAVHLAGLAEDLADGLELSREAVGSGRAAALLADLRHEPVAVTTSERDAR